MLDIKDINKKFNSKLAWGIKNGESLIIDTGKPEEICVTHKDAMCCLALTYALMCERAFKRSMQPLKYPQWTLEYPDTSFMPIEPEPLDAPCLRQCSEDMSLTTIPKPDPIKDVLTWYPAPVSTELPINNDGNIAFCETPETIKIAEVMASGEIGVEPNPTSVRLANLILAACEQSPSQTV